MLFVCFIFFFHNTANSNSHVLDMLIDNIARNGIDSQISDQSTNKTALNAIDGNVYAGGCAVTRVGYGVWWQVDLQKAFKIVAVSITARMNGEKLQYT